MSTLIDMHCAGCSQLEQQIKTLNEENAKLKSENELLKLELTKREIPIPTFLVRQDLVLQDDPNSEDEKLVIPRAEFYGLAFMNDMLLLTNMREKTIKKVSLDQKTIDNCNPGNCFDQPYAICVNNKNEIFVGDDGRRKIIVLSPEFQKIREFGDQDTVMSPTKMSIDDDENLLYLTRYRYNIISVFDITEGSETSGKAIISISLLGAYNIRVTKEFIYITGHYDPNVKRSKYYHKGARKGSNCIYVLEKKFYRTVHIIQNPNWTKVKGIHIDEDTNIYTMANSIDESTKEVSTEKYLFKIDKDYKITKYENTLPDLKDMIILDGKLIACNDNKIVYQKLRLANPSA